MREQRQKVGDSAVVIGAGMGGLLVARVLADYYAQVTVLERDTLPSPGEARKGVPQGRHAHGLLHRGREILEELFPGLTQALIEQGAARGQGRFFAAGGYLCRPPAWFEGLFVSRPCLEAETRAHLLRLPNVRMVENCDVLGLAADAGRTRVAGVRLIRRQQEKAAAEILPADLVVDAGGRGSRTPAWLAELGYPKPEVELVNVEMGYASRFYERRPEHVDGDLMVNIAPSIDNKRACGMLAQEGNRWLVTLAGYFGDYPPLDEQGFLAFARSLPVPDVYDVIRTAKPLTEPVAYHFPANQWRHYERLDRFPKGLLVAADAMCSFTPIYGQGITVAALEALALRDCLAASSRQLAQRFFPKAAKIAGIAWSIAAGNDTRLSGAQGPVSPAKRLLQWYMGKLQIATHHDPVVAQAFRQVTNMMAAPPSLLHPRIALRVLWAHLHHRGQVRAPRRQEAASHGLPSASS
jgi:2-polyprenyl-6-methoxyphenol hydroxylase-like FAD-dependent oxidoreductase